MKFLPPQTASLSHRQSGGLLMNMGIGIILGLLAALLAVVLMTRGGSPFKEHGKGNSIDSAAGVTDPNAPLYGTNAPPAPAASATPEAPVGVASVAEVPAPNTPPAEPANPSTAPMITAAAPNTSAPAKTTAPTPAKTPAPTKATSGDTVKVVAPQTAPTSSGAKTVTPATTTAREGGKYTVQAGAFNNADEAAEMKRKLNAQGQSASVVEKKTESGTVYRVRTGTFGSDKEAQAARAKVGGVVLEVGQ
jgi:cell division septation protein DedD